MAALAPACAPCDAPGAVCTVAGVPGSLGFNGDGLDARETWLYFPSALAWSPQGRLVVDDFNNMRIRELGDDGVLRTIAGNGIHGWADLGADALASPLENPIDIDFLPDGRLLISELHTGRVLVLDEDGTLDVFAGVGPPGFGGDGGAAVEAQLSQAGGIAVDAEGRLLIADTDNHCVRAVDPASGTIERVAGEGTPGFHDGPSSTFHKPQRVLAGPGGVWVADTLNHAVRWVDEATGEVVTVAGTGQPGFAGDGGPATAALLDQPYGLALAPDGSLLVADAGNGRVRRVLPDGTIHTLAGAGTGPAAERVDALDATFSFPVDVLVGEGGDVYVADMKNGVVRRIAAALDEGG